MASTLQEIVQDKARAIIAPQQGTWNEDVLAALRITRGLPNGSLPDVLASIPGGMAELLNNPDPYFASFSASFLSETPASSAAITYSGGANGTRVNSAGVIVPASCPRVDFDPVTLAKRGLLVEEQRTNLITQSGDLGNGGVWINTLANTTSAQGISPDGTNTAAKTVPGAGVVTTGGNGDGSVRHPTSTVLVSAPWCFSVYAKAAEVAAVRLRENLWTGCIVNVNLTTGAVVYETGTTADMQVSASAAGNGWWRIAVVRTTGAAENTHSIGIKAGINTGDGISGCLVWGCQLEQGAFPTSYIPTAGSAVTRTADVADVTGSNFSAWYNNAQGTLFAEWADSTTDSSPGARIIAQISNLATLNQNTVDIRSVGTANVRSGNVTQADAGSNAVSGKAAWGLALNNMSYCLNGVLTGPDLACLMPVGPTVLRIGHLDFALSAPPCGHIRRILYWNTRLPDATLQALTA